MVELALTVVETRTSETPGGMVPRLNAQFTAMQLYVVSVSVLGLTVLVRCR